MEEKIVKLIKQKDDEGLKLLMSNYSGLIHYIVGNIIKTQEDLEECVNDIYMKVWKSMDSYSRERGSLTTWITAISRNRAIDYVKRQEGAHEEIREEFEDKTTTEGEVIRRENTDQLKKAIARLTREEQHIFYRKYYYLQQTSQIASELGLTERAVEGRLYRIRKKLQGRLGGDING